MRSSYDRVTRTRTRTERKELQIVPEICMGFITSITECKAAHIQGETYKATPRTTMEMNIENLAGPFRARDF